MTRLFQRINEPCLTGTHKADIYISTTSKDIGNGLVEMNIESLLIPQSNMAGVKNKISLRKKYK